MLYRRIALLLGIAAAFHLPVSCSQTDKTETTGDTGINISVSVTEPPVFKEKDLGGENFTFLTFNENSNTYIDSYITSDAHVGNMYSEEVSLRNGDVKSMFNVNVVAERVYSPKNEAINRIQSGQCDFDVIYESGTGLSTLALDGLLYNFAELPNVSLARSYWMPTANEGLNVGGKLYIATNYISMNGMDHTDMIYYNRDMYDSLGFGDSLYESVRNGTWTIDKYVNAAVAAVSDVNEDGVMSASDRYGIWGTAEDCLTDLAKSSGVYNTHKKDNGSYTLDVYNEKAVSIYTGFEEKLKNSELYITYDDIWSEQPDLTRFEGRAQGARFIGFGEGHVLFMPGTLNIKSEFNNMEDGYGILPNPRYDGSQKDFYHFMDCSVPMFAVPKDGGDMSDIGLLLEYMAYRSEQRLFPAYAEAKTNGNADDRFMLEVIRNSVRCDWTELYELDVTTTIMNKMMVSGSFKSVYNRLYSKAMSEINGCVDTLTFMGLK